MKIFFDETVDTLEGNLMIDNDRSKYLIYRIQLIIHEAQKPQLDGKIKVSYMDIIKLIISLAENEQELVFCSFLSGCIIERFQIITLNSNK